MNLASILEICLSSGTFSIVNSPIMTVFLIGGPPCKWTPAGTPPRVYADAGAALLKLEGFTAAGIGQLAPDSSKMEEWAVKIATMRSTHAENLIAALARPLNV